MGEKRKKRNLRIIDQKLIRLLKVMGGKHEDMGGGQKG